ncbi:ribosome maturation factor RimP [Clostridia bacterium]|nr:ribosome maturation factor RimP [Clostridia bacterium]
MAGKKSTVDVVWELVQPIVEGLNLTLWDVRFLKEGAQWYLRIFIDSENGITIENCEAVSRAIDEPLDELDPIDQNYCLEVSSPGLERELVRPEHFEQFLGEPILVKLIRPLEGLGKEFGGILTAADKTNITATTAFGTINIPKKDVGWVKLDDFEI